MIVIDQIKWFNSKYLHFHIRKNIPRVEWFEMFLSGMIISGYIWNSLYRPDLMTSHTANFFLPNIINIRTSAFYLPPRTFIFIGIVGLITWFLTKDFHLSILLVGFGTAVWEVFANEVVDYFFWGIITNPWTQEWTKYWLQFAMLFLIMAWIRVLRIKPKMNFNRIIVVVGMLYFGVYVMWAVMPYYTVQAYYDHRMFGYIDLTKYTELSLIAQDISSAAERFLGYLFWSIFTFWLVRDLFSGKIVMRVISPFTDNKST